MIRANIEQLTPDLVRSANFSTTRLGRRGVDEAEVRAFCLWISDGLGRLLSDNDMLQAEIIRLRSRLLESKGQSGIRPEDAHVQAVNLLSQAQETADRYVADAQEYSRDLAEDARMRCDEILREAKVRASVIVEQAHASAAVVLESTVSENAVAESAATSPGQERQELQAELAYLRTFSEVCRTHLRAYLESLGRSVDEWEHAEHRAAVSIRESVLSPAQPASPDYTAAGA